MSFHETCGMAAFAPVYMAHWAVGWRAQIEKGRQARVGSLAKQASRSGTGAFDFIGPSHLSADGGSGRNS